MFNAHAERQRRIQQIEAFLVRMGKRFREEPGNDLYLIFDEETPNRDADRRKKRAIERITNAVMAAIDSGAKFSVVTADASAEDWQGDDSPKRFMQWCFSPKWFFVELPSTTLDPAEAERVLRERSGFRFIGGGQPLGYKPATVEKFNPFVKFYLYGDERLAAEEAAYVWFDLWNFPLDWTFYATAAAFSGKKRFECARPIT